MLAQRAGRQSLRKLAAQPASSIILRKFAAPLTANSIMQTRPAATKSMTPEDSLSILAAQRKLRPTSPHLAIYRPQITWYLSMLNRITGATISGGLYIFGAAYLVSPLAGWDLSSASMAATFAAWPLLVQLGLKTLVALPFTFHSINGVRHLVWDMGRELSNKAVIRTGWTVVGLSVVSALGLVAFL